MGERQELCVDEQGSKPLKRGTDARGGDRPGTCSCVEVTASWIIKFKLGGKKVIGKECKALRWLVRSRSHAAGERPS